VRRSAVWFAFVCVGFLTVRGGLVSGQGRNPYDLIRFLSHQSDRPKCDLSDHLCGAEEAREDREATALLVKAGAAALPDLERAMDSIEAYGLDSEYGWDLGNSLFYAYAKIEGPAALPRLQRIIRNPALHPAVIGEDIDLFRLDDNIALALGLTSYVSAVHRPLEYSGRAPERAWDLRQFAAAWIS